MKNDYDEFEQGEVCVYVIVHNSSHNNKKKKIIRENPTLYTHILLNASQMKNMGKAQGKTNHYR